MKAKFLTAPLPFAASTVVHSSTFGVFFSYSFSPYAFCPNSHFSHTFFPTAFRPFSYRIFHVNFMCLSSHRVTRLQTHDLERLYFSCAISTCACLLEESETQRTKWSKKNRKNRAPRSKCLLGAFLSSLPFVFAFRGTFELLLASSPPPARQSWGERVGKVPPNDLCSLLHSIHAHLNAM